MSKSENHLTFRVSSATTLELIAALLPKYKNMSALLNTALDRIIPIMYAEMFGKKAAGSAEAAPAAAQPSVARELKNMRCDIDDLFTMFNILEPMLTSIFNATIQTLSGEAVNGEELRSGALSDLPEDLQAIKDEIAARHNRRRGEPA